MGAVLAQAYEHGERPVAFLSKALSGAQLQYSMWEKELFAVVWAVKELRPYLRTHHFTLRYDNKPSVQLLNSTNIKFSTIATARILRWIAILQSYSFTPTHTPGKQNVVADALSRFPVNANIAPADVETALYCQHAVISYLSADLTPDFHHAYSEVPFLKDLFQQLRDNVFHPRYTLLHDLIISRDTPARVYIPDDIPLRLRLFQETHDTPLAGHPGFHKMYSYMLKHFFGPRLRVDILDYIRTCPQCQIAKPRHTRPFGSLMPLQPPKHHGKTSQLISLHNFPALILLMRFLLLSIVFQNGSFPSNHHYS